MSLKDKLSGLSQNLEKEKKTKEKSEEDKRLEPTRANIESLESTRRDLDLVKGSLDFKALNKPEKTNKKIEPKSGEIDVVILENKEAFGMQDYSEQTGKKIKTRSGELDALVSENKEALKELGVSDKEQLAVHPEFAEEEEVVNYKKSLAQGEELKMSDAKLIERLTKLGVELDSENFSYESASRAVSEKIKNIDAELAQEKSKTPEGKEEIINNLAKEFENNTGKLELGAIYKANREQNAGSRRDEPDASYGIAIDKREFYVNFRDDKVTFRDWPLLKLIPDNFEDAKNTYGEDIASTALESVYQNKISRAFSKRDEMGDKTVSLKEQIKTISPEEKDATKNKLDEFAEKQNELLSILQEKSKELEKRGIKFDPKYIVGYGDGYEDLFKLGGSISTEEVIKYLNTDNFPPSVDYKNVQESVSNKINQIIKFIEVIQNIHTEEDVKNLLVNQKSDIYVGKFHQKAIDTSLGNGVWLNKGSGFNNLLGKHKNYSEVEEYLNKKIQENSESEKKVSETIIIAIRAQLKMRELDKEIQQAGLADHVYDLKNKIEKMERSKEDAIATMGWIKLLQAELPQDEELSLDGACVTIPSIEVERVDYLNNYPIEKNKLLKKEEDIEKHKSSEPKMFGKDRWQKKLEELNKEKEIIQTKVNNYSEKSLEDIYNRGHRIIKTGSFSGVKEIVGKQKATGKASEIFNNLQEELTKVIDASMPSKILNDYEKYMALEAQLG